ncbi:CoA-binding protein [Candidatus Kuenenia stuttgartensis]|uniref:CoA-binding protein n=1 Tax=Kuenenia stuttgartiensis TaxID=174633 RepID=UPI001B8AFAA5|nr:CoA-binding protein [Candidatus Kuenenia stuttgartiensis]
MTTLKHFFSPKTVAVIGASREKGKVGHDIVKNLVQYGYQGTIYPVNPKAEDIVGLRTYANLKDIRDTIDMAIIVVPARYVVKIVDECAEKKIDSIVVISAGFKESGIEGAIREKRTLPENNTPCYTAAGAELSWINRYTIVPQRLICRRYAGKGKYCLFFTIRRFVYRNFGLGCS